ncbi:hypothetical protein [Ovoidimarina sediminis]|uniref:hypothetical protein n=1 Tax=Ovoidimarina sediminis TaxID=3079856 RepID=UPI00290F6564|nr:hypothetical protein [Rhodophyticola sp. MJ-SS7]MDU8945802.1 hypothetical protein [Rhodophyticola sp. MJ-SS7]
MQDDTIHEGDPGFEDFIEEEMARLGHRAQQRGICVDCLTDRFITEMVANLVRSGVPASDVLGVVVDGLALAEEEDPEDHCGRGRRVH